MFEYIFFGVLGLIIGSFLNVVVLREEKEEAITGRSHCPHCKHVLAWYELVPLASYLALRGKCRVCRAPLSLQYPFVELLTGVVFVASFWRVVGSVDVLTVPVGMWALLLLHLTTWATLVVITVYDFRTKLIPDHFNAIFAGVALLILFGEGLLAPVYTWPSLIHLLAGPALFIPFYLLWKVSDGKWIGLGDGKLAIGIGWLLGMEAGFSAVMFGFWVGAVVSLLVIAAQHLLRKKEGLGLRSEIPFGPFLVVGIAIVYFTGATFSSLFFY